MKPIGVIVGFVMRETKGRADGGEVTRIVRAEARALTRAGRAGSGRLSPIDQER